MFDITQPAYQSFRNQYAERTTSVVIWVGSGLSVPAGLPTWLALRDGLCNQLENKLASIEPPDEEGLRRLQTARKHGDLWTAYHILKQSLGPASYAAAIRTALAPADTAEIPTTYRLLWGLRIGGVLNLNLDRLATRAFSEVRPGKQVTEFSGREAGAYAHVLQSPTVPFIANLHGVTSHEGSWVLTRADLNQLLGTSSYRQFISACLTSKTVLFVGLTADDLAISGHLATLKEAGVDFGSHYWITARTDKKTDTAAERLGIRVIRYAAVGGDHSAVQAIFEDLAAFVPHDDAVPPVAPFAMEISGNGLPEPDELHLLPPADVRSILNHHAVAILAPGTTDAYEKYDRFRQKYDRAIYQAWYTSTVPPDNNLLGYTLHGAIAKGAFGEVFRAEAPSGEEVAIKVLHQEVRKTPGMLESFRRGVRSMRILSQHNVEGMVPYREAAEIPAFAVMTLVNGPNLKRAVESRLLNGWHDRMKLAVNLANIIRRAHALPERVLHRDIRPSNIMLEGLDRPGTSEWHVVVLDFDLSWHRGAYEKSLLQGGASSGYLAPEQLQEVKGVSTRNSAVDSYGFGMTMYFVMTAREPLVAEHRDADWQQRLDEIRKADCKQWRSLPLRVARLIDFSTRESQAQRWDMPQIEGELERLQHALLRPRHVNSAELIAEELIARTRYLHSYLWDSEKLEASIDLATGLRLQLQGRESGRIIRLNLVWTKQALTDKRRQKHSAKYVNPGIAQAKSVLKKARWTLDFENTGGQEGQLGASIEVDDVRSRIDEVANSLETAIERLRLD